MVMHISTQFIEDDDRANIPEMFGWACQELPDEDVDPEKELPIITAQRKCLEKGNQLL